MTLRATFVRTQGERDRIYVQRSDGTDVSWVFPTYGDGLPHDLVHMIVETVFSLSRGFWGRVDEGADPGRISEEANRTGGANKYAAFGVEQTDLQLAEVLAATRWLDDDAEGQVSKACFEQNLPTPAHLKTGVAETRKALLSLTKHWSALLPKGSLILGFDRTEPRLCLPSLGS